MSSVVDKPKLAEHADLLGIDKYTSGLIQFIRTTETPITVGIQGEWGSGKTSLMNTLREELCVKKNAEFFPIWINTWEYSLLSSVDETLVKIILGLIEQIGAISENKSADSFKKAAFLGKSLLKLAQSSGGLVGMAASVANDVVDAHSVGSEATISELRMNLENVIETAIAQNPQKAFVFFIDDLDRLDPTVAVNILELLKNIFDLHHCVFVIAVDYGVVIKGLASKFGEMTESNEWEFRAFFDKIIQLPFSMPMSSYDLGKYLSSLLCQIGYFETKDLESQDTIDKITEIVGYTVGANPRSLKRMANSVSLIEIIRGDSSLTIDNRLIEFALICTQIAYPFIYNIILRDSNFVEWDLGFAKEQLRNKKIDISALESLKETEDFDEEWEQALWYMCQSSSFLRERASSLSKLLSFIVDNYKGKDFESDLDMLLSASSVTNVSSEGAKKHPKRVRYDGWSSYQIMLEENRVDGELQAFMKTLHDEIFEMLAGKVEAQYTPGRISFKRLDATSRRKNFLIIDPKQKVMYLNFLESDSNTVATAAEKTFPNKYGLNDKGFVYMKIDKRFDFHGGAFSGLIEAAYNNVE